MKILRVFSIAITLLLLVSQAASAQVIQPLNTNHRLIVTAWIDGEDLLYITPTTLHWDHLYFCVVGHWGPPGTNLPTGLFTGKASPNAQYLSWIPQWPSCAVTCSCGYGTDSSTFKPEFPLPSQYALTDLTVTKAPSGGAVRVYQYPSADNGYTTIIDFDDNPLGGAHWYQVRLTFAGS